MVVPCAVAGLLVIVDVSNGFWVVLRQKVVVFCALCEAHTSIKVIQRGVLALTVFDRVDEVLGRTRGDVVIDFDVVLFAEHFEQLAVVGPILVEAHDVKGTFSLGSFYQSVHTPAIFN